MNLTNLDGVTRRFMLAELEADITAHNLYMSNRLSASGKRDYPDLLRQAITDHDIAWLADNLRAGAKMNSEEERRTPKGGMTIARVPITAPDTLAEGEFNRYYIRGLCLRAIDEGISYLIVHRAKEVSRPRPESEALIGSRIAPDVLLKDLRASIGVDGALKIPPGANSGLSVRLP